MDRRDHESSRNRVSVGKIIIVIGLALIVFGIGGLAYRQLDSESGAEAEALSTPIAVPATPTPEIQAATGQSQQPTTTPTEAPPSPSPTSPASATSTPSPSPTQTLAPTTQPSPTPGATETPEPTATEVEEDAIQPAEPPVPAPPVPAPPEPPKDESPGGSTVTHIRIPEAGIDTPVVEIGYNLVDIGGQTVITWNVAEWAAGHHSISANPGDGGNIVIAGHVAGAGEVFRTLEEAEIGDEVVLSTTEGEFRYIVEEVHYRLEEGAPLEERLAIGAFMNPMPEERLTLITCWPYGVYDHRLIVVAKPA